MASDGQIRIDIDMEVDKLMTNANKVDDRLKKVGQGAGSEMDKDFSSSSSKVVDKASETKKNVDSKFKDPTKAKITADVADVSAKVGSTRALLRKVPQKTITRLTADAEEHGINNFDKLLRKLPKKTVTDLLAKAEKGEVIDYEKLLRTIPSKYLTKLELNDNASPALKHVRDEAEETKNKFSHLKEIIAGSFIGNALSQGVSMITSGLQDLAKESVSASDAVDKFKNTMRFGGFGEDEIDKATKEVQKYADETVYDLNDVSNTTAQLAANGIKNYMGLTEAAGNMNAAAGGSADSFKSVAMMLTQTAGAGKLTTENWNQLTDAIPGASGKLQEAMKKNKAFTGNFRDAMAEGQISSDEFNKAIMELGNNDGAIKAAKSTQTFEGAVGNMQADVVAAMKNVVDAIGKKNITDAISTLGNVASKTFKALANGIQEAEKQFQKLKEHPALFKALTTSLKVLGGTFAVFAGIKTVIGTIMGIGKAFVFLNNVIKSNYIVLIISAVIALGVALYDLYKHNKKFRDFVNGLIDGAKAAWDGTVKWFKKIGNTIKDIFVGVVDWFKANWKDIALIIANPIAGAVNLLYKHNKKFRDWANSVIDAVKDVFKGIGEWFSNVWDSIAKGAKKGWDFIVKAVSIGAKAVKAVALAPIVLIAAVVVSVWNKIKKPTTAFWNWMKSHIVGVAKAIRDTVSKWFNSLKNAVSSAWNAISRATKRVWNPIKTFLIGVAKAIQNGVMAAFNALVRGVTGAWNKIRSVTHAIWDPIRKFLVNIATTIWHSVVNKFNALRKSISNIWNSVKNTTHNVWNAITGWVVNKAHSLWKGVSGKFEALRKSISGILGSISKGWHNTWNGMSDFFGKIWGSIKSTAKSGMNGVIGWLNGGIGGINSVIHTFGGKKNALGKIKKLANGGSGYRGIAMVNDGGGEEAIIKGGHAYKVQGKNAYVSLEGDETVVPHGASRAMFGENIAHYAGGSNNWFSKLTGWVKDKWDGIINFIKHPIKSLKGIMSNAMGKVTGSKLVKDFTPAASNGFVNGIWQKFKSMLQDLKTAHDDVGGSFDGKMGSHGVYAYLWKIAQETMKHFPGMRFTSGYRPGDPYGHGHRQAVDIAYNAGMNGSSKYFAPANWAFERFKKQIAYVITQGKVRDRKGSSGTGIHNGWKHWPDNDHYDHLHLNGMWGPGDIGSGGGGKVTGSHNNWLKQAGFKAGEIAAANWIVSHESGWNPKATNGGSGAYGLAQALPASKYASAGSDWRTNPLTQLKWMKSYIRGRYGTANDAKRFWQAHNWYDNGGYVTKPTLGVIAENNSERVINSQRDTADGLILDALNERADYAPNSLSAKISRIISGTQASNGRGVLPSLKDMVNYNTKINDDSVNDRADGNINIDVLLDGNTIGRASYPTIKALYAGQSIIVRGNGSIPRGGFIS